MWAPPIPNIRAASNSQWLQAPPAFSFRKGPGNLCLRRWVGASSSKNAMGQETSLSLLSIERDALLPKRDPRGFSR